MNNLKKNIVIKVMFWPIIAVNNIALISKKFKPKDDILLIVSFLFISFMVISLAHLAVDINKYGFRIPVILNQLPNHIFVGVAYIFLCKKDKKDRLNDID